MTKEKFYSPNENFEWPEFNTDKKRIQAYSQRYRHMSIAEAFDKCYNLDLPKSVFNDEMINDVPRELNVGDIVKAKILSIDKNKVTFDAGNIKTNIQSNTNLYKYDKLRQNIPADKLSVKVTSVQKDKIVVDPIAPMLDDFLTPILNDPTIQKKSTYKPGIGYDIDVVKVKNLQLTRGGFMGKAVIPNVSNFVGEEYTVDAFIPGSQIVLNITDNFEQFVGKEVYTFILNYAMKPGNSGMSLICSAKEVLRYIGELNMIQLFNHWCEDSTYWKTQLTQTYAGKVTGVINTAKKCGVFVEIPTMNITGMVAKKPEELVNYKIHEDIQVKIVGFEEELYYNSEAQQMQHAEPYVIENGILKKCSLKPILEIA